jgi:hypothetical protein
MNPPNPPKNFPIKTSPEQSQNTPFTPFIYTHITLNITMKPMIGQFEIVTGFRRKRGRREDTCDWAV